MIRSVRTGQKHHFLYTDHNYPEGPEYICEMQHRKGQVIIHKHQDEESAIQLTHNILDYLLLCSQFGRLAEVPEAAPCID